MSSTQAHAGPVSAVTMRLPSTSDLEAALRSMDGLGDAVIVSRAPNVFSSAAESEVVRLATEEGECSLLIKYGSDARRHTGHGYWGDVAYEAAVYRSMLSRIDTRTPRFYGLARHADASWLAIEYVDGERLSKSPRAAIIIAARWLGAFHRATASATGARRDVLNMMDAAYFRGWAERTFEYTRPLHGTHRWIEQACSYFARHAGELAAHEATVVHGEFYPRNVLIAGDEAIPVDWQSAATGPGEVDIASLTEGWGDGPLVAECLRAYEGTRWPGGAPQDFERRLDLARMYWPLRWLGDDPAWTHSPKRARYFEALRAAALRAGAPLGGEEA